MEERRKKIMGDIHDAYETKVHHKFRVVEQRNILLIGRTQTGKTTIKQLLVDPTTIFERMPLVSDTKSATFQSFIIDNNDTILNIIDTPGLFETGDDESELRNNEAILKTIEQCIQREITKFHLVGFCASFESSINEQDVKAVQKLIAFLGQEVSKNLCLIVTRCESKTEEQRKELEQRIKANIHFKPLIDYFQQGIIFSGCLDRDSWNNATNDLYNQFKTVVEYRERFIELLSKNIEPFMVQDSAISVLRQHIEEKRNLEHRIKELEAKGQRDEVLLQEYKRKSKTRLCITQ